MSKAKRTVEVCDSETDPFKHGRVPEPFIWGHFDGQSFTSFSDTQSFIEFIRNRHCYVYAHNGGRFDFMFLLQFIKETKATIINGRIVQMQIGKAILRDSWSSVPVALADYQKTDIDYALFERDVRHLHMDTIRNYLRDDCVDLFNLIMGYIGATGNKPTIAGNALAFAKRLGVDPGRTTHRFDNRYRPYYFGGRTECFKIGNLQNVNVYDIKSQYPTAMSANLPTGNHVTHGSSIRGFTDARIRRGFVHFTATSRGALPIRERTGLCFPWERREFFVPGWEYIKALELGLISHDIIHEFRTFEKSITFKPYIDHWFNEKQIADSRGDKVQRIVAKIMLNSLYGKLAQNPVEYKDYKIVESGSDIDYENGWMLGPANWGVEIHERPVLWRYQQKWGSEWKKFPIHYNVATAASITSHARASLLDGMASVGFDHVAYCDTDSIFVGHGADTLKLDQSGNLGSWQWDGFAPVCHIAGKKLYALEFTNGPNTGDIKIASKGAKLTMDQIALIAAGETIIYKREAPTFSLASGVGFVVRSIRATAQIQKPKDGVI